METKLKIIKIINEEIKHFHHEIDLFLNAKKYKDAKIAHKVLKRLEKMIIRIQQEA